VQEQPVAQTSQSKGLGRFLGYLRPVVAIILLIVLFHFISLEQVAEQVRNASLWPLALILVSVGMQNVTSALKVHVLVSASGSRISFWRVLRAYYIGYFFNNFLPSSVGGDVMKVREMTCDGVPLRHAAASVVMERGTGVAYVFLLGGVIGVAFSGFLATLKLETLRWLFIALGAGTIVAPLVLYPIWMSVFDPLLRRRRDRALIRPLYAFIESFYVFRDRPLVVAQAMAIGAVFYGFIALDIALAAHALGARVSFAEATGIVPPRTLPELLPISVGGLGLREGALTHCLNCVGLTPAGAFAAALLIRFCNWVHSAIGGIVYAVSGRMRSAAQQGGR
jgi:uncharacterized protein (TIRG00374 family)